MISIVPMESCTEVWQNKVGIFKNTGFQSICYRWIIRFNNMDVIYVEHPVLNWGFRGFVIWESLSSEWLYNGTVSNTEEKSTLQA